MSFAISKIVWAVLAPLNFLALLIFVGSLMALKGHRKWQKIGSILCFFCGLCLVVSGLFPVGTWAIAPLENMYAKHLPEKVDGIILLAGDENPYLSAVHEEGSVYSTSPRYFGFSEMAQKYPQAKLVFTGGYPELGGDGKASNAFVAKKIFKAMGMDPERITYEDKSRNTYENAIYSKELIQPKAGETWLLVTQAFHMPRAMGCFENAGWKGIVAAPYGYFAPERLKISFSVLEHLTSLNFAVHEYIGIVAYVLTGRMRWPL